MTEINEDAASGLVDQTNLPPCDCPPAAPTLEQIKAEADATATELARHEAADAAMIKSARAPSLGRIVLVRHGKDVSPGIVTGLHADGAIEIEFFRASHINHAVSYAQEVGPDAESGDGWYWPPRS